MINWDGRMQNTHIVKILKAAIPFLDVPAGEKIDIEGFLGAMRPYAAGRERHLIDMLLQFFQMQHMMEMMQLVQSMQEMQQAQQDGGNGNPMDWIKGMVPAEQQETVDLMMSMMSAMQDADTTTSDEDQHNNKEGENESTYF